MNKEQIVSFAANIISNGVETKLPIEKIQEGLTKYIEYLNTQGYSDEESLKVLNNITTTLPELVKLATVYGSNGITNLMLNKPLQKNSSNIIPPNHVVVPNYSVKTDRCGNVVTDKCGSPVPKEKPVVSRSSCDTPSISKSNCGGTSNTVSSSSCGGGRSMGRSSC